MANTFELIASVTLASAQANIDFTSIPSTYTDLVLKGSTRVSNSAVQDGISIKLNNNTAANYSDRTVYGNGSSAASIYNVAGDNNAGMYWLYTSGNTATSSTFGNFEIYLPNYAGSTAKSASYDSVSENNATSAFAFLTAGLWNQTAAVNQITLIPASGNFMQYSTAYLYGVKNA
jgi:hypothetical protein